MTRRMFPAGLPLAAALVFLPVGCSTVIGQPPQQPYQEKEYPNFDARLAYNRGYVAEPEAAQKLAVDRLRAEIPRLVAEFDKTTAVTRKLSNRVGFLTEANPQKNAMDIALAFVKSHVDLLGLTSAGLDDFEVTDSVYTKVTGATRIYLRQMAHGLPLYNGQLQINVNREGRILSVNNAFMADLVGSINTSKPTLDAASAVREATKEIRIRTLAPTEARLAWLRIRRGEARLVWNFQIETADRNHFFEFLVDAVSGKVWVRFDRVLRADYRVFPLPVESPNHTTPAPPADGRVLLTDPANATASPLGWHNNGTTSFTIMRGNNVHAYEDSDNDNLPPGVEPDCGGPPQICDFDFPIDFGTQEPNTYTDAAVANLFYWVNIIHDVQYQYGFDEDSGNFQANNFGLGGLGDDDVRAQAQDGSDTCNAGFLTKVDGKPGQMQIFTCNMASPARDGDFDNLVIVHEYGHGISNRLVGGPSTDTCLYNAYQPGEGISDWLGLWYTAEVGDQGADPRTIGTYLLGQAASGPGFRTQPYSTDPAVNDYTYETINLVNPFAVHFIGSVWAQAYWEVYWALVDEYGFDPDLYNALGGSGNQRAMLYLTEGLKNTGCEPDFLDVRDGIILAATDNFGGEDVCLMWEAFAAFGLGIDAVSASPEGTSLINGFEVPSECAIEDQYAVKFVCGEAAGNDSHAPGVYFTDINVHNPTDTDTFVVQKFATALPEGSAGTITKLSSTELAPDAALQIGCQEIRDKLGASSTDFLNGFVIIGTTVEAELDVVAVYTVANAVTGQVVALDVEHARRQKLPDLVPVPGPEGFCQIAGFKLEVTVKNQGEAVAPASIVTVLFGPPGGPPGPLNLPIALSVPALALGEQTNVETGVVTGCIPDCLIRITVDATKEIYESLEGNNVAVATCDLSS